MQQILAAAVVLGLCFQAHGSGNAAVINLTPVQKVLGLLTGMLEKGKLNKHEEEVQFASFKQFCEDTTSQKQKAIKDADEAISMLKADMQKYEADAAALTKEISGHDADVATWSGDMKAATKVREIEKVDYDKTHKDYSESVDALQRAIAVLQKQAHDREQASLTQVSNLKDYDLIPKEAKRAIDTFLAQAEDGSEVFAADAVAPKTNAYEFQSHGIIEMLQKLMEKFVDERTDLEKTELNGRHAYDMLMQDLKAQSEQATQERSSAAVNKARALQDKADARSSFDDTTSTRKVDQEYFADLRSECTTKASDFESRQELRAEELQTLEKAIEIISGNSVAGAASKHLPSLLTRKIVSFASLRTGSSGAGVNQVRTAQFLRDRARSLDSRVLSVLATKVAEDPFTKVKKMIQNLITRLMEEANEEAEHKGWCDTELSTNEQTRKEKTETVQTLHAEIDELQANMGQLSEDIGALTKQVADLSKAVADATRLRQSEKAENKATVQDAADAQTAVAQALLVLKEFYAKAAESTALLQTSRVAKPPIFDSAYRGMGAESGGVIGMLEVIQSDFARLESETRAAESSAVKSYNEFMTESKVDKASKSKDIEHKSAKKQDASQTLVTKVADLEGTQKELDAALTYYDKLKPSCVDSGASYGDRVARRKEEIESLQEALKILNGEDI